MAANLAAQAQVKADKAALENANLNLGFTRITSPIDGLAGIAQAQIGDLVGPTGNPLTTVSTIDPIKVYFKASEQAYLKYRRQHTNTTERTEHEQELELQLILADGSVYPYPGRFFFAGREVNPTTGTMQLTAPFPQPGLHPSSRPVRPGARQDGNPQGALLVPQRAVTELQGSYQVATVDAQNKVHIRPSTWGNAWGRIGSLRRASNPATA